MSLKPTKYSRSTGEKYGYINITFPIDKYIIRYTIIELCAVSVNVTRKSVLEQIKANLLQYGRNFYDFYEEPENVDVVRVEELFQKLFSDFNDHKLG